MVENKNETIIPLLILKGKYKITHGISYSKVKSSVMSDNKVERKKTVRKS